MRRTSGWLMTHRRRGRRPLSARRRQAARARSPATPRRWPKRSPITSPARKSAFGIPMRAFGEIVVGYHRVRRGAELHRRRKILQRSRLRAGRAHARRRRAGRRHLERAAGLDQRQRDLERDHLGRRHHPGDEAHRLPRRLRRRRRGGRLDRRGADAAGDGLDRVRDGVVPRQALRRDRARRDSFPALLFYFALDGADRRLCGAPRALRHEARGAAAARRR